MARSNWWGAGCKRLQETGSLCGGMAYNLRKSLERRDSGLLALPVKLITDKQGNAYSLLSGKAKEFSGSAFLMRIVLLLYHAGTHLCPYHRKRDLNQWADEFTHPSPSGFSANLHFDVIENLKSFSLLTTILPQWSTPT